MEFLHWLNLRPSAAIVEILATTQAALAKQRLTVVTLADIEIKPRLSPCRVAEFARNPMPGTHRRSCEFGYDDNPTSFATFDLGREHCEGVEDIEVHLMDQQAVLRLASSEEKISGKAWPIMLMFGLVGLSIEGLAAARD